MGEPTATKEETEPLQVNSAMDDEQLMGSKHTFGTTNISDGNGKNGEGCEVEIWQTENEEYIQECDETIKPHIGQCFEMVDQGVQFYKRYAAVVGFDVRCSTLRKNRDGDAGVKYLLCSREGYTMSTTEGTKTRVRKRQGDVSQAGWDVRQDVGLSVKRMATMQ